MKILGAICPPEAIKKILDCLELPSRFPPMHPAVGEPTDFQSEFLYRNGCKAELHSDLLVRFGGGKTYFGGEGGKTIDRSDGEQAKENENLVENSAIPWPPGTSSLERFGGPATRLG